jgi:hypothetical protein
MNEQELAGRIAQAVAIDEQTDGCDLSGGLFGRAMSDLIRELVGAPAFQDPVACSSPGTGSDTLDCILGVGGFASFGPLDAQPAAHLTIPGALECDGDNGTHGADGESRGYGESKPVVQPVAWLNTSTGNVTTSAVVVMDWDDEREHVQSLYVQADGGEVDRLTALCVDKDERMSAMNKSWADCIEQRDTLRTQLANTEQSRRSFFDLSQDLEKRLVSLKAFAAELISASFEGGSFDGGDIQDIGVKHGLLRIERRTEECGEVCACREYGFPAECYRKTDLVLAAKGGEQ